MEEACGFVSEYLSRIPSSFRKVWESEEDPIFYDTVLEGKGKDRELDETMLFQIHNFILDNLDVVSDYCV